MKFADLASKHLQHKSIPTFSMTDPYGSSEFVPFIEKSVQLEMEARRLGELDGRLSCYFDGSKGFDRTFIQFDMTIQ